jgi:uncharacterized protein (UPF0210 family)
VYKFRALTYHAPPATGSLDGYLSRLKLDDAGRLAKELSARKEVWSVRVVSPPVEDAAGALDVKPSRYVEEFYETAIKVANYVAFPLRRLEPSELVELMRSFERAYFSVEYRLEEEEAVIEVLRRVPEEVGWVAGSRFAVAFGGRPVTPYFPVTTSETEGVTASLLYPTHVAELVEGGEPLPDALRATALEAYKLVYNAIDRVGTNLPLIGLDLSLSPWASDSVALLLEKLLGLPLFSPGTFFVLRAVNEALSLLASSLGAVGFNEVMLPLAEDDRLKELAAVGHLRFRDLLATAPACVAGLDMVPLPSTTDARVLKWAMRDLDAASKLKRRPLGMRLLLVGASPGEEVELGMFGKTPVIDPLI